MRDQAKAMQGQLDQMTAAQRPWMLAHNLTVEGVDILPDDAIIMFSTGYKVTNFGQSPATDVFINTGLFVEGVDATDVDAIRKLCKPRPLGNALFLRFYRDIMGPNTTWALSDQGTAGNGACSKGSVWAGRAGRTACR